MSVLPEIQQIEKIISTNPSAIRSEILAHSEQGSLKFPIHKISFGSTDPKAPVLGFIGGVHGLERIGAQVCVALMSSLAELIKWDITTRLRLRKIKACWKLQITREWLHKALVNNEFCRKYYVLRPTNRR